VTITQRGLRRALSCLFSATLIAAGTLTAASAPAAARPASAPLTSSAAAATSAQAPGRPVWQANGVVYAMARHGGKIYIGGDFRAVKRVGGHSVPRYRLAAFSERTGKLLPGFHPRVNGPVRTITVGAKGTLYVGGGFSSVNGIHRRSMAAIFPGGRVARGFTSSADRTVRSLVLSGGGLYAGGVFKHVDGRYRSGLARIRLSTGELDRRWSANVSGGGVNDVHKLAKSNRLLVGGKFRQIRGQRHAFIGSVSLKTGAVQRWRPKNVCDTCAVLDIATAGQRVFAGVGGRAGGRVTSWNAHHRAVRWNVHADGDIQAVAVRKGTVYAGGHFRKHFGATTRRQFGAVSVRSGHVRSFKVRFAGHRNHPGVWSILAGGRLLRIGGGFLGVNGSKARRYAEVRFP